MKGIFEKWYVLFMMMRIARHNKMRIKLEKKYNYYFDGSGQDTCSMTLEKHYENENKLYRLDKDKNKCLVASKPQRDDFGLYEYVDQHQGYCEDYYFGTIYTKTPIKNLWLKRYYDC
ncbi:hypothetical protein ACTQ6A_14170 [Lachnospiraceae bacterium LCP25S3_G4]